MLRVMPREMRLMTERVLSQTKLPFGFALTLLDVPMYSQKMGLGGFAMFEARFPMLREADPTRIRLTAESGSNLSLDAGGQHAWVALPSLVDLLGELVAAFGVGTISIDNIADADELEVLKPLGRRSGLAISVSGSSARVARAVKAADVPPADDVLHDLLQNGASVSAETWWCIYERAKQALAPDTIVSRRHAGPIVVNEDGSVIGRTDNDDDTDISFLLDAKKCPTDSGTTGRGLR